MAALQPGRARLENQVLTIEMKETQCASKIQTSKQRASTSVTNPVCVGKSWIDCTNALTFRPQCDNTWQILELNSSRRFAKRLTIASSACRTRMNEAPRLRLINAFAVPLLGIGFAFPGACAA